MLFSVNLFFSGNFSFDFFSYCLGPTTNMPSDQLEQALLDYSKKIISQYLYIRNYVLQIHSFFQMIPRRHNDETSLASPQISVDLFHISFFQVIAIIWLFSFLSASPWAHFTKVLQPKLPKNASKDQVELFPLSHKSP